VIFRKARATKPPLSELDGYDRRRRGRSPEEIEGEPPAGLPGEASPAPLRLPNRPGPYDLDEIEGDLSAGGWIDLGGLRVRPQPGVELRLQVDEASRTVVAALLVHNDSALELRAFAAPRSSGLWDEIRREIAQETTRRGGVVTERTGPHGPEITVVVPSQTPDGQAGTQASRIVGIDGPRWFLRGTFIGRAALDPRSAGPLQAVLSDVVVVRGRGPMAPRDMIPLKLPESARRVAAG